MEGSSGLDSRRSGGFEPALPITGCETLQKAVPSLELSHYSFSHSINISQTPTVAWNGPNE